MWHLVRIMTSLHFTWNLARERGCDKQVQLWIQHLLYKVVLVLFVLRFCRLSNLEILPLLLTLWYAACYTIRYSKSTCRIISWLMFYHVDVTWIFHRACATFGYFGDLSKERKKEAERERERERKQQHNLVSSRGILNLQLFAGFFF